LREGGYGYLAGALAFPFLHKEVAAAPPLLGVFAPFRGLKPVLDQEVLRGDWNGGEPVRA